MTSYRLNEVVKQWAASSLILMTVTLVAGICGMNSARMPEVGWAYGYPFARGLMLVMAAGLVAFFRHIDWL